MTTHRTARDGRRGGKWLCGGLMALALLSSVRLAPGQPPAQVNGCTPKTANAGRYHVLTHQLLKDTGVEIAHHPLRAGATVLHDGAGWVGSVGRGIIGKRLLMRLHGAPRTPACGAGGIDPALLETNLEPAFVRLYREGGDALAVLEKMIDSAACRIDILMYIWEDDEVGWAIARHLAAWAGPERRVRILIDGGANLIFVPSPTDESPASAGYPISQSHRNIKAGQANRVVCWLAQQPHIELIRIRNPLGHFDHRKLVLIDGQAAWAGGRNFSRPAFFVRHDLSFTLRGPLVSQLQNVFENYWRGQGGQPACIQENMPPFVANAAGRLVENAPTRHSLRHALYRALDHARSFAWMENPYFCDNGVITKLARARRRGVDARVVLTIRSDSDSINRTNRVTANRLLAAGVRVYLYPGRIHTKAAAVDGCWGYLGSGNFDLLSLRRNHELGVVFGPGPVLNELDGILFQTDFRPEWELHAPLPLTIHDITTEMLAAFFL